MIGASAWQLVCPSKVHCRMRCAALVGELNQALLALTPAEFCYHMTAEEMARSDTTVFVAREDGAAVAWGALRRHGDGVGEVKRMYTRACTIRGADRRAHSRRDRKSLALAAGGHFSARARRQAADRHPGGLARLRARRVRALRRRARLPDTLATRCSTPRRSPQKGR